MEVQKIEVISRNVAALEFIDGVCSVAIMQMQNMPYKLYLQTQHWQHFRKEALKAAQYECQLCNEKDKQLDVTPPGLLQYRM